MFNIYDGRSNFYQWDINQKLIVEDSTVIEVHFCNKTDDCALVCETYKENGLTLVNVPNILLQDNWDIRAYAYCNDYTKLEKRFKVIARSKPADYIYTETEVKNYEQYVAKVAELDERVEALEGAEVDLTGYVKDTDFATGDKAGVVKVMGAGNGVTIHPTNHILQLEYADKNAINKKAAYRLPIAPQFLDYAVKVGVTTNTETLTEDEKAAAQNWLGITDAIGNITKLDRRGKGTLVLDDMNEGSKDFTVRLDAGKGGNKNLVFYPYTNLDYSNGLGSYTGEFGITFTENEDGSIAVSCWTPPEEYAGDAGFSPYGVAISKVAIPADEDYCVLDSNLYVSNGYLCFYVDYGMDFDGNIYPQVEAGSTPTEFIKPAERIDVSNKKLFVYTGGTNYMPSIDYSQTYRGITIVCNKEDGSLKITGTKDKSATFDRAIYSFILQPGTYTYNRMDIGEAGIEFTLSISGTASNDGYKKRATFTIDEPTELFLRIKISTTNTTEQNVTIYPQLNKGEELLDFEIGTTEIATTNVKGEIDKVFTAEINAPTITTLENATICAKYSRKLEAVIEELTTAIANLGGSN